MSLTFIGENVPELRGLSPKERRRKFLHAVGQSYKMAKTWAGLVCFLILTFLAEDIGRWTYSILDKDKFSSRTANMLALFVMLAALVVLGKSQISAIRDVLKKDNSQPSISPPPRARGGHSEGER